MKVTWHEKLCYAVSVFFIADLVTAYLLMNFTAANTASIAALMTLRANPVRRKPWALPAG